MQSSKLFSIWAGECTLCAARATTGHSLCEPCTRALPRSPYACPRCARAMPQRETCGRCLRKSNSIAFDATFAAFRYTFPSDILVAAAKYRGDLAMTRTLGTLLAGAIHAQISPAALKNIDLALPIPLAPSRQAERGYNQAAEIARVVAKALSLPLASDLMRTRETEKQADLPLKQRARNVRDAFSAASLERPLAGKHVLLIDDVMTTGATLNEAAKALKDAGAIRVTVAVVARAVSRKSV